MKLRSPIKTFWLLAFLLVAMPLVAGCWSGDESPSRHSRPVGDAGSSSGLMSRPATDGGSRPSTSANKIQNINVQGAPGIQFGTTKFKLVPPNELVNQYIPVTQTLDNWEEMFVVRRFPELSSPQEAIDNVVENLIKQGKDQNLISVKQGREPENELAIDFVIWNEDKSLTEFNIHVYRRVEGGMIANMYLMRGYGLQGHETLGATVATNRELILKHVLDSQFPLFTQ